MRTLSAGSSTAWLALACVDAVGDAEAVVWPLLADIDALRAATAERTHLAAILLSFGDTRVEVSIPSQRIAQTHRHVAGGTAQVEQKPQSSGSPYTTD
jgi:hypothetical protein